MWQEWKASVVLRKVGNGSSVVGGSDYIDACCSGYSNSGGGGGRGDGGDGGGGCGGNYGVV